ncbi:hypothetical protein J437_LFUL017528 [Ladona fulva]|uniref:Translation elongation factor EF1B beta/delta subunit guanine nucleotide exchange domain-containing protein n=1 Tax=Ladona fulva TaxID=123851 RepID=A0A8K0KP55_LADFU|nr:hypothetical protein J437_LFUL017528 [Ladona fulva]
MGCFEYLRLIAFEIIIDFVVLLFHRFVPTQSDTSHFDAIQKPPTGATPHALRWYNHIKSFGNDRKNFPGEKTAAKPAENKPAAKKDDDDDDIDLFGSDDDEAMLKFMYEEQIQDAIRKDAEAAKIREERLKEYAAKKSKKPAVIAKSSIVLDVKPWDDETDMKAMEEKVRSIQKDGLVWGQSRLQPVGYGINKLQIGCVIEDEKISVDLLTEEISEFEDVVQSVDIASFNKI